MKALEIFPYFPSSGLAQGQMPQCHLNIVDNNMSQINIFPIFNLSGDPVSSHKLNR